MTTPVNIAGQLSLDFDEPNLIVVDEANPNVRKLRAAKPRPSKTVEVESFSRMVNELVGITETYELPDALMAILADPDKREETFGRFLERKGDLSVDWFADYFQENHSNRDAFKQDFTPTEVCRLVGEIAGNVTTVADVCAGTGALTIAMWRKNPDAVFHCEELSTRALPILLFNLAIRNMSAIVAHCDVLTRETFEVYRLTRSEKFSEIVIADNYSEPSDAKFDAVIMNPPYSVKRRWDGVEDERFAGFGLPPNQAADFAFVLHGLSLLKDGGRCVAILPHGVLFRANREKAIRRKLIVRGLLSAVIGLPDKLFLNTGIPVCLFVLERHGSGDVLMVDASKGFEAHAKLNVIDEASAGKIVRAVSDRVDVERFAHVADLAEIEENDFNLNIPRYVDTFVPAEVPDILATANALASVDVEIRETGKKLIGDLEKLVSSDAYEQRKLKRFTEVLRGALNAG